MRSTDLSPAPQSTGRGAAVVQNDNTAASAFPDDPTTARAATATAAAAAAAEMPVAYPSSSILYTLLQDLGLTATAQALCEELQRQQSHTVRLSPPSVPSLPSQVSEVFVALSHGNGATSPHSLGTLPSPPPYTADVSSSRHKAHAPTSSSVEPLPASAATAFPVTAVQCATPVSPRSSLAGVTSEELQRKLQSHCHTSQCTRAIASLAACAIEPLLVLSAASPASASTTAIATPLQLVDTLTTLWRADLRTASGVADAAVAVGGNSHRDDAFQVAALIARAAWCEVRITELVFTQELHLAYTSAAATAPSAAGQPLQEAQRELVEVAGQLVAALQELRTACGAAVARGHGASAPSSVASDVSSTQVGVVIASSIVSHLHSKSIGWLRNAECVMAWVLRRHGAFDPSADAAQTSSGAQQQQQRKRRCLEPPATATSSELSPDQVCSSVASPLLKPLQDVILGFSTVTSAPAPSYQQCLDAEIERSAATQVKSGVARETEPIPAAASRGACVFSSVRIPVTVRVAMTVQRVKLLLTLISALVYNGEDSILCVLGAAAADRIRTWWTRQSAMLAQFLVQCAHQLNSILTPSLAHSSAGVQAAPPPRLRALSAASEAVVLSLQDQLEALAAEVLLCAYPAAAIASPGLQGNRLALCMRLMNAIQKAHDTRTARLDWYALKKCTAASTAAANTAMSSRSPLSALTDVVLSPLSSASSPTYDSEVSPITSPAWTLRVPSPPGSDLRMAAEPPMSSTLAHRSSIGSDISSISDSLEAARTAAQVLQWKPHFTQLLATIATGRWQAQYDAPQTPYPGSRYHRLRLHMKDALRHAQELLRLQPRFQVGARGVVYPPHPTLGSDPDAGVPLSVVEQLPRMLQLATLQDARVLQRCVEHRLAREAKSSGRNAVPAEISTIGDSSGGAAVVPAASLTSQHGVSPALVAHPRTTGLNINTRTSEYRSATSVLAAATVTAIRRPHISTPTEEPATPASARPSEGQRDATLRRGTGAGVRGTDASTLSTTEEVVMTEAQASSPPLPVPSEAEPSSSRISPPDTETGSFALDAAAAGVTTSPEPQWENGDEENDEEEGAVEDPQLDRWHLQDEEAQEELEEVDEEAAAVLDEGDDIDWAQSEAQEEEEGEEDAEEAGSQASSADMDYERAEDDMKEEVECIEATPDGRLLALLTARGRLMVLRLQPHDSIRHYEEEVLIDTSLPNMPSREKRLQWYESLSSFVHFSPCHRFVLAAVQFAAVELKPSSVCAIARAQSGGAGQLNIYSLHRNGDDSEETDSDGGGDLEPEDQSSASAAIVGIRERLHNLVGPVTDRLYGTFHPHSGPCLSARWVDPRWWGGGRRSRWANSAIEPLNSTSAAATVLVHCMKRGEVAGKNIGPLPPAKGLAAEHSTVPKSWRAAAGVLLSEYQCVSVGIDDLILRWLPACGVVLQRILAEPVQDIVVSPLMAAFYVTSDSGDLYMYDAWDERNVTDGHPCGAGGNADSCNMYNKNPSTAPSRRLILPVTEEGHPIFHRVGRTQQQQQEWSLRRDTLEDPDAADQVYSNRSSAHYTGPVTPVFQRVVDPSRGTSGSQLHGPFHPHHSYYSENIADVQDGFSGGEDDGGEEGSEATQSRLTRGPVQDSSHCRSGGQAKTGADSVGWTRLPQHLRWLLPHHWAAHTPWDAQLGRRIIRNLLRQTHTATPTDTGELFYERDAETPDVPATLAGAGNEGDQPSLTDEQGSPGDAHGRRHGHAERNAAYGNSSSRQDASSSDEDGSHDTAEREYAYTNGADYDDDDDGARRPLPSNVIYGGGRSHIASEATAAAAAGAKGIPVSVLECAAHPTPARGPLQRAYYPSGTCLVYKSVAKALCNTGDLTDRQMQNEMGPGGSTHHLLNMAFSGEPQWMSEQRLWDREAEEAGASQMWHRSSHQSGAAADYNDCGDAYDGATRQQRNGDTGPNTFDRPSAPLTQWSTAALARLLLWKDYFSTSHHLAEPKAETWAQWESDVLATTYHADVLPLSYSRLAGSSREPRWSAAELLAARGYLGPRDAWRHCAPTSQRGLAATARNGRYLCIMASVGPYRKLVNPREPLRDMPGLYACVVFDVYAGAVLRVIPVCPTELSGLRGRCMWTSERHESDPKAPIYRLPCTVTVVPLPASSAARATAGKGTSQSSPARACGGSNELPRGLHSSRNLPAAASYNEGVVGDEEDGEPAEVVALTIGGLGNCVYVFDALSGRRLALEEETTRHCGESAAAAYEASVLAAKARTKAGGARSESVRPNFVSPMPHIAATPAAAPTGPSSLSLASVTAASRTLPASIRKPADVLASVATWGRGTGFDGITDRSSSTASSPDPSPMRGMGVIGEESSISVQPNHSTPDTETAVAAAAVAMPEAVAQSGAPVPWLLQDTGLSQLQGWHLRGILWWVHKHPQPSTLYGGGDDGGGATDERDASWSLDSPSWGEAGAPANGGSVSGNSSTRAAATRLRGTVTNGGASNNAVAPSLSSTSSTSAASSALSFFYQTLLGVSGMTGSAAVPPPPASSATSAQPHFRQAHAAGSSPSALSAAAARAVYPSYGPAWRQRRRRLLERLLRHYDVGMLWQAYVTLFCVSTTATNSLAPQSAVHSLVQWALSTDRAATTAAALLGPSDSHTRWIWCLTHASRADSKGPSAPSKQLRLPGNTGRREMVRSHDLQHSGVGGGGTNGGVNTRSTIPFAQILQQREDFMAELQALDAQQQQQQQQAAASPARSCVSDQAKSLLSCVRDQAMAEGTLPLAAKARGAQQQQRSTAAAVAHESSSPAAVRLPPSHHQNQLHVEVVNCVATWFDANGGFYVCCGSEDGGLYIMGGNVTD